MKVRPKHAFLSQFTSLFRFVTPLRRDHTCRYCQVSRQSQDKTAFDMTSEIADRGVDFMFKSPSRSIKVEFQGGQSLLNFEVLRYFVETLEARNSTERRDVEFVIATNLAPLTDDHLRFCLDHRVQISTSLDGPKELHNSNRPRPSGDSYELTIEGIQRARKALGDDQVSALMTTTAASLSMPTEIVDEYVRHGFRSIFLRSISPYGFAVKTGQADAYQMREWLEFYRAALTHIIDLNLRGGVFREEYATLILPKMLTPYATGYVDLQSPAGVGTRGLPLQHHRGISPPHQTQKLPQK